MMELFTVGLVAAVGVVSTLTVMGFLGRLGWIFELVSHFRLQYLWTLLLSAAGLLAAGHWRETVLAAGMSLVNASTLAPFYARRKPPPSARTYRATLINLLYSNRSHEVCCQFIREARPDFLLLIEVTPGWLSALRALEPDYPSVTAIPRPDGFGMALFSRIPFETSETFALGPFKAPSILARWTVGGRPFTMVGSHPYAPTSPDMARVQDRQLAELARLIRRQSGAMMVLGDLNSTSWSPVFRRFLRQTGLRDSREGFGLQPSWPVAVPMARIPIDHCLVSSEVAVHTRRLGRRIGSDHFPVIVDFSIAC